MNKFKFLSGAKIRYVPIITSDTHTTYHIPIDMYGQILQLGVDLHRTNLALFSAVNYDVENEIGVGISYLYKIDRVIPYFNIGNRISIEYSIRFPDTEYYCNFITTENTSLHETI